ncbi:hypothetical protein DFH09DRAFT_1426904 [Mycena vulgaris]|nr:hypothetical protein DFH09DRAFT_1426904 [Mycena vulgaris]
MTPHRIDPRRAWNPSGQGSSISESPRPSGVSKWSPAGLPGCHDGDAPFKKLRHGSSWREHPYHRDSAILGQKSTSSGEANSARGECEGPQERGCANGFRLRRWQNTLSLKVAGAEVRERQQRRTSAYLEGRRRRINFNVDARSVRLRTLQPIWPIPGAVAWESSQDLSWPYRKAHNLQALVVTVGAAGEGLLAEDLREEGGGKMYDGGDRACSTGRDGSRGARDPTRRGSTTSGRERPRPRQRFGYQESHQGVHGRKREEIGLHKPAPCGLAHEIGSWSYPIRRGGCTGPRVVGANFAKYCGRMGAIFMVKRVWKVVPRVAVGGWRMHIRWGNRSCREERKMKDVSANVKE